MHLSVLHTVVRTLVQGEGVTTSNPLQVNTTGELLVAERAALQALQHQLQQLSGHISELMPQSGADFWLKSDGQKPIRVP